MTTEKLVVVHMTFFYFISISNASFNQDLKLRHIIMLTGNSVKYSQWFLNYAGGKS